MSSERRAKSKGLRPWQARGLQEVERWLDDPARVDFSVYAFPATGKTYFGALAAKRALAKKDCDLIIIVSPTEFTRDQWVTEMKESTSIGCVAHTAQSFSEIRAADLRSIKAISITFATLIDPRVATCIADILSHERRIFGIDDEIHHCSTINLWGIQLEHAFENARRRLSMSGTPFRTDKNVIPYIMKPTSSSGRDFHLRPADVHCGYVEAILAGHTRVAIFRPQGGTFTCQIGGKKQTFDLQHEIPESIRSQVYDQLLNSDRISFSESLLKDAWKKLSEIRNTGHPDAAMLVVASSIHRAERLSDLLRRLTGQKVILVTSKTPNAKDTIDAFRKSSDPIIVSVQKLSEGVDINRIRVVAYLSRVMTELFFRQVVGRALRLIGTEGDACWQIAYIFMPRIEKYIEFAKKIEDEIVHAATLVPPDRVGTWKGEREISRKIELERKIAYVTKADPRPDGVVGMGAELTEREIAAATRLQARHPHLALVDKPLLALMMRFEIFDPSKFDRLRVRE